MDDPHQPLTCWLQSQRKAVRDWFTKKPKVRQILAKVKSPPIPPPIFKSQIGFFLVIYYDSFHRQFYEYHRVFVSPEIGVGGTTVLLNSQFSCLELSNSQTANEQCASDTHYI